MDNEALEAKLAAQAKGPRLTPDDIDGVIVGEAYHVFEGTTLTVACLTLANGFTVIGEAACVDPANFDAATGREIAYAKARDKVFELEGYRLRQRLYERRAATPAQ